MIKFDRDPASTPPVLDMSQGSTSDAATEFGDAEALVLEGKTLDGFAWAAYKHPTVRNALREMFFGKCAYCESKVAAASDTDIEHYRPKGSVKGTDHPGYWWLAMRWENLVLSCPHCNQSRRQEYTPDDRPDGTSKPGFSGHRTITTGKLHNFPLVDGDYVTDHTKSIEDEKPVFIDPTVSDPADLIGFDFADHLNVSIIGIDEDGRGQGTILGLGLNRRWLKEARMSRMGSLQLSAQAIQNFKDQLTAAQTPDATNAALQNLRHELLRLRESCKPNQPFAGMNRAFFRAQLAIIEDAIAGHSA